MLIDYVVLPLIPPCIVILSYFFELSHLFSVYLIYYFEILQYNYNKKEAKMAKRKRKPKTAEQIEALMQYRADNKEMISATRARYYQANKEEIKAKNAAYRATPEAKAKAEERYKKNAESMKASRRAYYYARKKRLEEEND